MILDDEDDERATTKAPIVKKVVCKTAIPVVKKIKKTSTVIENKIITKTKPKQK